MASKYAAAHQSPQGPGDARPTARQIVEDEGLVGKLTDKVFLVTGTSSGIGIETAGALAATGATVFCTARNLKKAETALAKFGEGAVAGKLELVEMDNNSLASVRAGAADFLARSGGKLNVLVCNAGIMALPKLEHTADGFEAQFGTNHLSHFLLFQLVKQALLDSATPDFASRVVMVSSSGHLSAPPQTHDYHFTEGGYSPWVGYGQSKTSNIWMANYIDRVYGPRGIHATSLMPGGIMTGLQIHVDASLKDVWENDPVVSKFMKDSAQGAATTVLAAVGKEWEGTGGKYLEDCRIAERAPPPAPGQVATNGHADHAYNPEGEQRLWSDSLKMVGVTE